MQPKRSRTPLAEPATAGHTAPVRARAGWLLLVGTGLIGACSSVGDALSPSRVDYRNEGARTAPPLDVPPDLTQLSRDMRYQVPTGGSVSASALQTAAAGAARNEPAVSNNTVAPRAIGGLRLERGGSQRWLVTAINPEDLWPQLRQFWTDNGFELEVDKPEVGVMETNWAENRARLPQDFVRRTLGRVFDRLFDSGERDRYRTRVERVAGGTEIYITHRGMNEVVSGNNDATRWQVRASDPELEIEMLSRLMLKLGGPVAGPAGTAVAEAASAPAPTAAPARARAVGSATSALQVDDGFERAWRRVGLALDRSGFTVEDRDRNAGTYYVRYVDPKLAGKEEPGFFSRLFGAKSANSGSADRYRVVVKADNPGSLVTVLDSQGEAINTEITQRIVQLLVAELR